GQDHEEAYRLDVAEPLREQDADTGRNDEKDEQEERVTDSHRGRDPEGGEHSTSRHFRPERLVVPRDLNDAEPGESGGQSDVAVPQQQLDEPLAHGPTLRRLRPHVIGPESESGVRRFALRGDAESALAATTPTFAPPSVGRSSRGGHH